MLAGVVLSIGILLVPATIDIRDLSGSTITPSYAWAFGMYLLGMLLLLVGLLGLYAHQSEAAGLLGLVGFVVAFLATALMVGVAWALLFFTPSVALAAPGFFGAVPPGPLVPGLVATFALAGLGWVLFGAATVRARVYPRVAAIVLMLGAVVSFVPSSPATLVFNVGVVWMGFVLFTGRGV